ncbi:MAG: DUF1349 domain-containing protein [Actinomycetia bacterium]|jgi:hypothetical protein|nr:DUF1349 domain-containing protein [Actinomycetes bacterium]
MEPAPRLVRWDEGDWSTPPTEVRTDGTDLVVVCAEGSDLWRTTSYGFVHDDGHGLLVDLPDEAAVEVAFVFTGDQQFDQAGVLVRADERHWVKAGVEIADGQPQVGAVVTRQVSDWSTWPVPGWAGREINVRASRDGDALVVRARAGDEPWHLVRVAPLDPALPWRAGPFCCAPSRSGFEVRFTRWTIGPADGEAP